jgi:hypothetical protein
VTDISNEDLPATREKLAKYLSERKLFEINVIDPANTGFVSSSPFPRIFTVFERAKQKRVDVACGNSRIKKLILIKLHMDSRCTDG